MRGDEFSALGLTTPCLVVDSDVLEVNLRRMAAHAHERGTALRPHAKTHKCLQLARRQLELGAVGLTVATVGEAEVFAAAGLTDLFIAYPVWAAGARGHRLRALAERATLRVGVESVEGAEVLARALSGTDATALIEVDSGHHRTGADPEHVGQVAVTAVRAGLRVSGVFTFPGHGYGPDQRARAAADESRALQHAADALRRAGVGADERSGGSTPTAALTDDAVLTEMRPGVYVFNDAQQVELGAAGWNDVALTTASTVISRSRGRVVLDAGSKALGADRPAWTTGGGRLLDHPHARITALSEHHATVVFPEGEPTPDIGSVLRVVPNHVCSAVNLTDELVISTGNAVTDRWQVVARGRND